MLNRLLHSLLLPGLAAGAAMARGADLGGEASAFLRANAGSPVHWMAWGDAAAQRAREEQRPVFLFVGSFTSELAAAMRRQTFANPKTADWLNAHFVCVIVDRDERPDVAALYKAYVSDIRQVNGWPINVWLTPDLLPYEGSAYLSPSEDWGAPGFLKLASQAETAWSTNPAGCRKHALEAVSQLAPIAGTAHNWSLEKANARLAAAADAWTAVFDSKRGGFGDVPRAPEPELLRFLLLRTGPERDDAVFTLRAIAASAIRDPLDGGFFRFASDGAWNIPYPQKTLADQARIALAYLDGAKGVDAAAFGGCARGALDYALGRLSRPDGTFAAAVDATGDDYANYYTWTEAEIDEALGPDSGAFKSAHGVEAHGNVPVDEDPSGSFTGRNLLRSSPAECGPSPASVRLLALRDKRKPPLRDERATAGAHGLLLAALSQAAAEFGESRYLGAAVRLLGTMKKEFLQSPDGALRRFAGSVTPAAPDDYAAFALGCRAYARAANDPAAEAIASVLLARLNSQFYDDGGGRYFGSPSQASPYLFARPNADGDPPSAEALVLAEGGVHAREIAAALSDSLAETNALAPGDELLGIALFSARDGGTRKEFPPASK